jgi:hypothetical protein
MGIDHFMEMMWRVHGNKSNKDMVALLETMKERSIRRTKMINMRRGATDQPYSSSAEQRRRISKGVIHERAYDKKNCNYGQGEIMVYTQRTLEVFDHMNALES